MWRGTMGKEKARVKVFRFNPEMDKKPRYESYEIPFEEGMSVLRSLRYIYENLDGTLAYKDYFCKTNQCGMCAMKVNGRPVFACNTKLEKETVIDPLPNFPIIRDVVVDTGRESRQESGEIWKTEVGVIVRNYRNL
jgi:succinate dehydrogenase/fumarate reductase iron-sulfur protein